MVLNKANIANDKSRITEIERYVSRNAIAVFPEDPLVKDAEKRHIPLCLLNDKSNFSLEMQKLAEKYVKAPNSSS
jgi:MinD-like ATPase involved in chromosome partitioning or flagellar assembly